MNTFKRLKKKIVFQGIITIKTGLHIGGSNSALNIGGPDKFVVRNPINNIPYIPGSSLKGKLRSLIEITSGSVTINKKGEVKASEDPNSISGSLFGVAINGLNNKPSRLIVRDAELLNPEDLDNTDLLYTESKTENFVDRVTAKATPRTFERVPAGAKFKLNMVLNIFEGENEEQLINTLKQAIELLEEDYLGGHGSRGYGQVKIDIENTDIKTY